MPVLALTPSRYDGLVWLVAVAIINDVVIILFQHFRNKLFFDRRWLIQRRMGWFAGAIERQEEIEYGAGLME
jgi:hypothetical protein